MRAIFLIFLSFGVVSCGAILEKTLESNPSIVFNVIEKNPKAFMDSVNKAVRAARDKSRKEADKKRKQERKDEFKNPKKPVLAKDRAYFGPSSAPITIVEYSDFQCPYCARGHSVIQQVRKKYGSKVRVLYKHLPLDDLHPQARLASRFYEAVALQSARKAEKFHDELFANPRKIKQGQKYFVQVAKKVKADVNRVLKDITSAKVKARIKADIKEARKFGFTGTPAFLINGVSLKGAYPLQAFSEIIDQLSKK